MPASKLAAATRAFVSVLLALERAYDLALQVNRDSAHDAILRAYRKVLLKAHPDKGGSHADTLRLQAAKGWIRRKVRTMDLADMRCKGPPLTKAAYTARLKGIMRSQKAQAVAKSYAARFRKTCKQVADRGGAGADN